MTELTKGSPAVRLLTNDEETELSGYSCRVGTDTRMSVPDSVGSVL